MPSTAESEAPVTTEPVWLKIPAPARPAEPKVNQPHAWAGRSVFYWRVVNQTTGEISPLPAMLIGPTRLIEGAWELNFFRKGQMQGR